ncbi:MAG: GGDEF domain-containing protein [Phycisphaerales bacterium]
MQEASFRVILAGRTGLDAALRKDPSIELLRVKTPVELVGELSQPIDAQSPADAVVIIGPEVEEKVEAADMVSALRMISPRVRVLVSTATAPTQNGFDGVIRPDATVEMFRELLRRTPVGQPASLPVPSAKPTIVAAPSPVVSRNGSGGALPPGFIVSSVVPPMQIGPVGPVRQQPSPVTNGHAAVPPAAPVVPVAPAAPQIEVTPAATREAILPRSVAPQATGGESCRVTPDVLGDPLALDLEGSVLESVAGPLDVQLCSTVDDRDVIAAVTAGRSPLPAAVALLRHRLGAPDVSFFSGADAPAATVAGAPVMVGTETVGHLASAAARPEQLADGAQWLSGWLVLRDAHRHACRSALTDGLTGAYNRRFFDRFLPAAMTQARKARHDLSVLLLDVDNFKTFNDRYGHAAGDMMLNETVRLLRSSVRQADRVCRIGGDEFAVVFFEPEGPRARGAITRRRRRPRRRASARRSRRIGSRACAGGDRPPDDQRRARDIPLGRADARGAAGQGRRRTDGSEADGEELDRDRLTRPWRKPGLNARNGRDHRVRTRRARSSRQPRLAPGPHMMHRCTSTTSSPSTLTAR